MAVQFMPADLEERAAASARLLEDIAQTCAVLRASCLEHAQLLRLVSGDARVLERIEHAEQQLAGWHGPYAQQPAPVRRVADGR